MCEGKNIDFINRSIIKYGSEAFDYSEVNYINLTTEVIFTCKKHNKRFTQKPNSHLSIKSKNPCPLCSKESYKKNRGFTNEQFIGKAIKKHGDKYDYNETVFNTTKTDVTIFCNSCSQYFTQIAGEHLKGRGCKKCGSNKIADACRHSLNAVISKIKNKFGNKYDTSLIKEYSNVKTKLPLLCKDHGVFEISFKSLMDSSIGCQECALLRTKTNQTLSKDELFNRINNLFGDKCDVVDVSSYVNCTSSIELRCLIHGIVFKTNGSAIIKNDNVCPLCKNHKNSEDKKSNTDEFIFKANLIHSHKYGYSNTNYNNAFNKVTIDCPFHGEFTQSPHVHLSGSGCPRCASQGSSKKEKEWLDSLNIGLENRDVKLFIGGRVYKVDGYDPLTNTVYEFHGDYWHGNPLVFNSDDINRNNKTTFGVLLDETIDREVAIIRAGYRLVTMWERDYEIMKKEVK